jgi:hypothetical protein
VDDYEKHLLRNEGRLYIDWQRAQRPEKVARGIVKALERNWKESVVGWRCRFTDCRGPGPR